MEAARPVRRCGPGKQTDRKVDTAPRPDPYHIVWWENGGRSDIDGLTLLCNHHHHRIHDGGWQLQRLDDGGLRFTGADGRVLNRPPPPPPWPMRPPPPTISPSDNAAIRARLRALADTPAA